MSTRGAIAGLADAAGVGVNTVEHIVRSLRTVDEADGYGWRIGSGRRAALISLPALINAMIVLTCSGGQVSEGLRRLHEFHQLRSVSRSRIRRGKITTEPPSTDITPMLHELLCHWVNGETGLEQVGFRASVYRPTIRLILTNPMSAEALFFAEDGTSDHDVVHYEVPGMAPTGQPSRLGLLTVQIGLPEIEALARVARDSYRPDVDLATDTSSAPGRVGEGDEATTETKKAAGTGIRGGLPVGQPATEQTAPLTRRSLPLEGGGKQLRPDSGGLGLQGCPQPATKRTSSHGAHWSGSATA